MPIQKNISILVIVLMLTAGSVSAKESPAFSVQGSTENQFRDVSGNALTEVKYGNKIYLKIASTGVLYSDEKLDKYMGEIRKRLIQDADRETLPYLISVTKDRRIYAASTPGGYVYLSLGLLLYVRSESELAGALAHEIAQCQYKTHTFRFTTQVFRLFTSIGKMAISLLIPGSGRGVGAGMRIIDKFALRDRSLKISLEDSDQLAVAYLKSGGFRPEGLMDFLENMQSSDSGIYPFLKDYLAMRPVTADRMLALKALLQNETRDTSFQQKELQSYRHVKEYVQTVLNAL